MGEPIALLVNSFSCPIAIKIGFPGGTGDDRRTGIAPKIDLLSLAPYCFELHVSRIAQGPGPPFTQVDSPELLTTVAGPNG